MIDTEAIVLYTNGMETDTPFPRNPESEMDNTNATPEKLMRCGAWEDCAYYATIIWKNPDNSKRMPICSNCSRLYKLDGWEPVDDDLRSISDRLLAMGYTHRASGGKSLYAREVLDHTGGVVFTGTAKQVVPWILEREDTMGIRR